MRGAKHSIANLVLWRLAFCRLRGSLENSACELGAGYPGKGRLGLVFAADLEDVEEVGRSGVDGDEVLVWFGLGVGEVGDLELFWSLFEMSVSRVSGGNSVEE